MNPTILGVIGAGFLNQVPTLPEFGVVEVHGFGSTLTYQNLQKSRAPINSILGLMLRTYKKVGFGRLR